MCRTEIQSWTTKKYVQLALDEQKQQDQVPLDEQKQQDQVPLDEQKKQDQVPLDEQKQQDQVHLDEQKQQDQVPLDEQKQHEEVSQIPDRRIGDIPPQIFYELCRFDSTENFLNCLKCLYAVKDELSLLEILLILRSNLCIFSCRYHSKEFIVRFKALDIISALQVIEGTIRYMFLGLQSGSLKLSAHERSVKTIMHTLSCNFRYVQWQVQIMMAVSAIAFPTNREEILNPKNEVLKLLNEIVHSFTSVCLVIGSHTSNSGPSDTPSSGPSDTSSSGPSDTPSSGPSDTSSSGASDTPRLMCH